MPPADSPMNQVREKSFRILVVDDDEAIRSGLQTLLTLSGYTVEVASNTVSALHTMETRTFDLVITDIIMPGESGLSLIQDIKHYHDQIKVIAISGGGKNMGSGLLAVAKKLGVKHVLQKPISSTKLLDTVQLVLDSEIKHD